VRTKFERGWRPLCIAALLGLCMAALASAQTPAPTYAIEGRVVSGATALPGASVIASSRADGRRYASSTDETGAYRIVVSAPGLYVVRVEMSAFAASAQRVELTSAQPTAKLEFLLTLASRAPKAEGSPAASGYNAQGRAAQRVQAQAQEQSGLTQESASDAPLAGMPTLAASDAAATQSVAVSGQLGSTQDYGQRSMEDMRERIDDLRASGALGSMGGAQGGGFGGGFGGPGGGGFGGPGMRRMNSSAPHGSINYNLRDSIFDAQSYALNGQSNSRQNYAQNKFGASLGGMLYAPHVIKSAKDFYFINYSGGRALTPQVNYSTVPTELERTGDFSQSTVNGKSVALYDPLTHAALGSQIAISPVAQKLLAYIPRPNQSNGAFNYRYATTSESDNDQLSVRLNHSFGAISSGRGQRSNKPHNSLSLSLNWSRSLADAVKNFETVGGASRNTGWNLGAGWSWGKQHRNNNLNYTWNASRANAWNRNTGVNNVAAALGLTGVSSNPYDYGAPTLSFTDRSGLSDAAARISRNQTHSLSEQFGLTRGKHSLRFGGDWRVMTTEIRNNSTPNGSFTFTGAATAAYDASGKQISGTGYDLADFLLGYADQTRLQYSALTDHFRAFSYDFFAQDDWRIGARLTLNYGVRYEYQGPFVELDNRLVNLDVSSDFSALSIIEPGQTGPYHGPYNRSLVRPDRNNFAPRIGVAWKLDGKTVLRAGYGVNYNLAQYRSIVSNLSAQPPFATTATRTATAATPLAITSDLTASAATVSNNYGVDPNYKLAYVQLWNLNLQRELPANLLLNIGYVGSKGTALDMMRAPNYLVSSASAFLWETSQGFSVLHSGNVRLRKRMSGGMSVGGTYAFSKSIDNASSIGGGSVTVAQNDNNLRAERGLSSFDQRHKLSGDFMYQLPFGANKRWLGEGGKWAAVFGDWTLNGSFGFASGMPFTATVKGDAASLARGVNGSLRANYNGERIALDHPTRNQWFNTAAFSAPASGMYGTAGRDTIIGPGSISFNLSMSKDFILGATRGLQVRADVNNVLNHANYTSIDTVVNSPTFGRVTAVGAMRSMSVTARFRF